MVPASVHTWSHRGKESRVGDLNRKKLDMLRKWKSKYVTKANYLKLAEVFHNHDKNDLVAKLCDLLSSVEDDGKSLAIQGDWQDCWKRERVKQPILTSLRYCTRPEYT